MRREQLVLLAISGAFGFGTAMWTVAAPNRFLNIPWISHCLFWGGLALMLLTVLDCAWLWFSQPRLLPALVANAGFVILSAGLIWQFSPSDESDVDSPQATSAAVAQLAQLGWTVRPGDKEILFEVTNRSLPPMKESAEHFSKLRKPFTLHLQSVKSLDGLHWLADVKSCSKIEINAGEFTDISELHGFTHLTTLIISQLPLDGNGVVDASALASLTNLELLNLHSTRVRFADFLTPLKKLKSLDLAETLVADLSPLSGTNTLLSLEIRDTRITDLTPLADDQNLAELAIGNEQVPGLVNLAELKNLKKLSLMDQRPVDLTPIAALSGLESLSIWGLPEFDLTPLGRLSKLESLSLSGMGFDRGLSGVRNLGAISNLHSLKTLSLNHLDVNDVTFIEDLTKLVELNLNQLPILSLARLRGRSSLKKIALVDIRLVDISPLLELPRLSEVRLIRVPARVDVVTELKRRGVNVTP